MLRDPLIFAFETTYKSFSVGVLTTMRTDHEVTGALGVLTSASLAVHAIGQDRVPRPLVNKGNA